MFYLSPIWYMNELDSTPLRKMELSSFLIMCMWAYFMQEWTLEVFPWGIVIDVQGPPRDGGQYFPSQQHAIVGGTCPLVSPLQFHMITIAFRNGISLPLSLYQISFRNLGWRPYIFPLQVNPETPTLLTRLNKRDKSINFTFRICTESSIFLQGTESISFMYHNGEE